MSVRIEIIVLLFLGLRKRKVRFYSKGIGLSVYPSKHLGFGFKSEPRKLFVSGLSVSLENTWELVLSEP